jgi:hypothetical protein
MKTTTILETFAPLKTFTHSKRAIAFGFEERTLLDRSTKRRTKQFNGYLSKAQKALARRASARQYRDHGDASVTA